MSELSKEFDKEKVAVTAESLMSELNDAFSGGALTQAEKKLKQKAETKQGSALFKAAEDPSASQSSQPEGEMDEKALRRQKLKERAYKMS